MKKNENALVSNKKAFYNFEIIDTLEAGIVLKGSEVKAIREHSASINDSFVIIKKNEAWLINSKISTYSHSTAFKHEENRERKLLLHKKEIEKLKKFVEKTYLLIPLSFYLKKGNIKVNLAIAKSKKKYDKRESIKEKEEKRRIQKLFKR